MRQTASAALTQEIADAGLSLVRLLRYDPRWPIRLDVSAEGFFRSFFGPLLATPFAIIFAAIILTGGGGEPLTASLVWASGLSHLINVFGFAVLVGVLARPLGFSSGYGAFIILTNWATLFLTLALCVLACLSFLGPFGQALQQVLWLVLFMASLFITWRAARETLSTDLGPALLMVVLSVGVGVGADQVATLLVRAFV